MVRHVPAAFTGAALPAHKSALRRSAISHARTGARACAGGSGGVRSVILAPGQGAQTAGMGLSWAAASSEAQALLDEADVLLQGELPGRLSELMRAGGPTLDRTDVAQPALFVAGAMSLSGSKVRTPLAAGGLSLGEYTALYAAGALSFADGVRLVAARGAAMQRAAVRSAGGMVALLGADEEKARSIALDAAEGDVLVASNFNAPGQVVLSGTKDAVARAAARGKELGMRAAVLDVAGAFHSPLMQPAADDLARELAKVNFKPLRCPVVSNVTGKPFVEGNIAAALAKGLTSEVRWEQCVRHLLDMAAESEAVEFVELSPGKTLAGMMRKIDRKTKVKSLDALIPEPSTA